MKRSCSIRTGKENAKITIKKSLWLSNIQNTRESRQAIMREFAKGVGTYKNQ